MSITTTSYNYNHEQNYKLQKDLISKINVLNLNDFITFLRELENRLSEREYNYYVAIAYYKSGDISTSIKILNEHYGSLLDEDKLMLADMLITIKEKGRAKDILDELYKKNKYLKNLFSSILRLNLNSESFKYWLELAKKYDPDNPAVIELWASKLSSEQNYEEAAKVFRELSKIRNEAYYELVARMNDILAGKFSKDPDKIDYINKYIDLNPQLRNEGCLRLANYFIFNKQSYFCAYQCLKSTQIGVEQPKSTEIIKLKIDILKDEIKISKALYKLKPFSKLEDAERIAEERTKNIVEFIQILASKKAGYLIWRDFLTCQDNNAWNKYSLTCLYKKLEMISSNDINSKIRNSYLIFVDKKEIQQLGNDIESNPKQAAINLIRLLRSIKNGDFELSNFNTFEEFVKATLTPGEVLNDDNLRIISRYYVSIIASSQGKHQDANNYALSVLELYDMIADSDLKNFCLYLGLLSWGYSQYRIGRHTEGILCIISLVDFCTNSSEVLPFLEEGLNIISRFITDDVQEEFKKQYSKWSIITDKLGKYNENFFNLKYLCANDDDIISELSIRIDTCEKFTVNWAGDVVNLIARYAKKINLINLLN